MTTPNLFGDDLIDEARPAERAPSRASGPPRIQQANRHQLRWEACDLDSRLAADHPARAVWSAVEKLDLSKFYVPLKARGSAPGRPAIDPKILVGLWLYATRDGVGSARELARLCEVHDAYRWICGGVSVNHHSLSDFRVGHQEALDDLFTQLLGVLTHHGLVKLERVAQDGMRVRASAGAASFRREASLTKCLAAAREQVEAVKRQADEPDSQRTARQKAAAERAAREREERVAKALAELPKAQAAKKGEKERAKARVSTTEPGARVMKMGDGGYRPAHNVELATDTESRVIVGVGVTNVGSDRSQMEPMLDDIERRTGKKPEEHLVDGGFVKKEAIEKAAEDGVTVYAPLPKPPKGKEDEDPHQPKEGDSEAIAAWRTRMGTEEAKEIYKERAATAETVNADLRTWRGLDRFNVRGAGKVTSVVLWAAITYNLMRWIASGVLA